ncbi:hypothetical protein PTTG_07869 [Puccinia triticina 1-1 BBBD Race 1]|uniref:S4 RNA-binding domain-containing protein n=1 Tax=Puccinia triticina (isolate 1-1 / race 1 (BBBD)) TaxID=630390 RepID=A0A180GJG7_PUCT1|nr:hypothetical protein PTTG_07869 [Puccinia triticina 1-1 BBBD Race 1]
MRKLRNPFNVKKSFPRMSWNPQNLFNLYQRSFGPENKDTNFLRSSKTVYWQKWRSKAVTRAYHGDWIQEKKFKRHYLPASLPALAVKASLKKSRYGNREEKVPLAALMYQELERRLDVAIFRSCFADSVYEARRIVIHGAVKLNGVKCNAPWTRLHPGDMFTIDPMAIPMLNPGKTWPEGLGDSYVVDLDQKKKPTPKKIEPSPPAEQSEPVDALSANDETAEKPTTSQAESTSESSEVVPEADEDDPVVNTEPSDESKETIKPPTKKPHLTFTLPTYASPFLFIPPYLEVSFRLCTSVYLRHPTSGPGYCEIPTPWDADGEVMKLAWEWYTKQGLGRRIRRERKEWDALREMKRDPFAEGHLRKHALGGRVAVHGKYEGGRVGTARLGSAEPRLTPFK